MVKTGLLPMFAPLIAAALLFGPAPALANPPCSVRSLAGAWVFATDVGQQMILPAPGDITAIGTINIDREGNISGKFDFTVAGFGFFPNNSYTGSITVNPDCTGTVTFVTSAGTGRTDSIVVVNRNEIWSMSQDIFNLWTARARRISKVPEKEHVEE
jgi:hypothetical protein